MEYVTYNNIESLFCTPETNMLGRLQSSFEFFHKLLLLTHFSRVRLCATPQTAAHQAPVSGILQARTLRWVAISFSNE